MSGTLAVLGTGSDVGKSLVCSALLRLFRQRGLSVAPFKAQNMSNNSAVTLQGLEMGRAQYVQALAAGLEPEVWMNPVLIKPEGDANSQVVLRGKADGRLSGADFFSRTDQLRQAALEDFAQLKAKYGAILIEGAGSLAEVNLRSRDYINLGLAQAVRAPVVLLADIDRGGVFAQIVGSLDVISPEDRALIKGILINRFRGSRELFQDGIDWIEERTGLPVLGLLPHLDDPGLPSEDAQTLERQLDPPMPQGPAVAVLRLPRISNFTDFEPLARIPGLELHFLSRLRSLEAYQLVILPGSKATLADLEWLRQSGWAEALARYRAQGGQVLGICGGFQMLGGQIEDPEGHEGAAGSRAQGLGWVPMDTTFTAAKQLRRTQGQGPDQTPFGGYEIHQGQSQFTAPQKAWLQLEQGPEGWAEPGLWGTYQHGLFESGPFLASFLQQALALDWSPGQQVDPFNALAAAFEPHLDVDALADLLNQEL